MQFTRPLTLSPLLLASVSIVSGCAGQERTSPAFPPAADVQAAVEPKPVPTVDILTSDQASADYSASVESWGDRIHAAGGRICRWIRDNGGKLPFECPPPINEKY